jgi:hypothetical protein
MTDSEKMVLDRYSLREGGALEEDGLFPMEIGDVDGSGSGLLDRKVK